MIHKTYKACEIIGTNNCYVHTGNNEYTVDIIDAQTKIPERYTITGVFNRGSALMFIMDIKIGYAVFDEYDEILYKEWRKRNIDYYWIKGQEEEERKRAERRKLQPSGRL